MLTNANGLGGTPAWIQLTINGTPPATDYTNGAYDPITNRLIVYGGCYSNCGFAQSDVIALTNANGLGGQPAWTPVSVTNPRPRDGHTAVFDSIHNLMITFGGGLAFYGTDQNDTAVLTNANGAMSPSSWNTLATLGGPPDNREEAGANYDEIRNRMILFAGNRLNSNFTVTEFNDVWTLSNANGMSGLPNWTLLSPTGTPPHTRLRHSQVYDSNNNRMIVFGGLTEVPCCSVFGDLWQLSNANGLGGPSAWTQLTPTGTLPGPTYGHRVAYDITHQRMIIAGGADASFNSHNRVWVLALQSYKVCLLYDPAKAVHGGAVLPVRIQICDSNGSNRSSADIIVHATNIAQGTTIFPVQDSGRANPGNNFRFDSSLGGTGGYIFNLSTRGLGPATYKLNFTIGNDSTVYSASFQVE